MQYTSEDITFSIFNNAKDNSPRANSNSWDGLKRLFGTHAVRPFKDGPAWSPATYPDGATRGNKNVASLQLAVLDVDNNFQIEAMLDKLKELGLCAYCHSSHSHTQQTHKYRVILLLSRKVLASDWALVWRGINTMMGGVSDQATKDPARLYYLPSRPNDSTEHFFHAVDGHAVDVDALIADAKRLAANDPEKKFPLKSWQSKAGTGRENEGSNGFDAEHSAHPEQGLAEVAKRCAFISYFSSPEHQNSISEPLWMAGITNNACSKTAMISFTRPASITMSMRRMTRRLASSDTVKAIRRRHVIASVNWASMGVPRAVARPPQGK